MRIFTFSFLALGGLASFGYAASFAELAAQLPECGVKCATEAMPQSPCDMEDSECLCTDETFAGLTQECVAKSCTVKESMTMLRLQNAACGIPVRSQQNRFRANAIAACVLAEICIIFRIYSKLSLIGKLAVDDYFIIVAGIATIPYLYLHCTLADLGFGLDIWNIEPIDNIYPLLRNFWIDQILYSVHLYSTKISILCFLVGIFPSKTFRTMAISLGVFVGLSGVATLVTTALQCLPVEYNSTSWDGEHEGHCNNLNIQTYAFGAINMVCDLLILVMPLRELYNLKVKGRQKIQLFIMFSVGIVVTVFSIIRLPFLVNLGITSNPTWDYVEVTIWSIWETELGMICASMPALRHLFKRVWPNVMRTIVAATVGGGGTTKASGYSYSHSASVSGRDKERSKIGNKDYYELDETSLMGKGNGGTTNSSVTALPA